MSEAPAPSFPPIRTTVSEARKARIAAAAWSFAGGSQRVFEQLCAQQARGEINLFGGNPTLIAGEGSGIARRISAPPPEAVATEPPPAEPTPAP